MTGLSLSLSESTLVGYLLASARVAGFAMVAPPFAARGIPARARATFIMAMAMPLTAFTAKQAPSIADGSFAMSIILNLLMGAIAGYFVLLAVQVVQMAGDLVDLIGGFSMTTALDPMMMAQSSVMGRLHGVLITVLLFVSDLHLTVLYGFARSVQAMPEPGPDWTSTGESLVHAVSEMFMGGIQVAAPFVALMLLVDIALGMLTRAAPALNAFAMAFPIKILLTLMVMGLVITHYPAVLETSLNTAAQTIINSIGGD